MAAQWQCLNDEVDFKLKASQLCEPTHFSCLNQSELDFLLLGRKHPD